ncbi:MAG: hypothetical protein ACKO2N_21580 [Tabrizicola sp.]
MPLGWGAFELFWLQSPFWGVLFLAAGVYSGYMLFFQRDRD